MTSTSDADLKVAAPSSQATVAGPPVAQARRNQFRPDIEGMRGIAVVLVILYHGFGQPFSGGYVGVDVFFVISGFLITSLLLREQQKNGRISMAGFYARRVRRILPASALVVVLTLFASYHWLGFMVGNSVAADAKWTAVFAANLHFGTVRTDYLGAQSNPSPLQHMWSLGVEEQFYLVWPAVFLVVALLARGRRHRRILTGVLVCVIAASLCWSVVQTSTNQTWAYFSPLTRVWELALGALIAVLAPLIGRSWSKRTVQILAVVGMVAIIGASVLYTSDTPYPGIAAALPVVGSAVVIAAGCTDHRTFVLHGLSLRPMQWLGARSYSLYLWHWPLLVIPAQYAGQELGGWESTLWILVAVLASAVTFRFVENPVRRSRFLASRTYSTLVFGIALIASTVVLAQWQIATHYGTWDLFR